MTSVKRLRLNRRKGIVCGVCAGLASYFNIAPLVVRILFVIAVFTWPLTLLAYVVLYFLMRDSGESVSELGRELGNNRVSRHFKGVDYGKRLYKSRRNRKISGVCAGIADYLEIDPIVVRLVLIGSLFFGPFGIIAYIVAAIIMDEDPRPYSRSRRKSRRSRYVENQIERQIREKVRARAEKMEEVDEPSPVMESWQRPPDKRDLEECSERFSNLEAKLRRLEATITSRKFKLHNEFKHI